MRLRPTQFLLSAVLLVFSELRLNSLAVLVVFLYTSIGGQTSVATGSVVGTITDTSGAAIIGAQISITNGATGQEIHVTTNSAGTYNSGALLPGSYTLHVSASGFATVSARVTVLIGNTTSGDVRLPVRAGDEVIDVTTLSKPWFKGS
jgi:Carboxypeptidase regulatory-like domain